MKKYILIIGIILFFIPICIFVYFNINISLSINKNKEVIDIFNNLFKNMDMMNNNPSDLPKIEINDIDYIGIININKYNLSLPIESKCNFIKPSCNYSNDKFIILGTNLKNSFSNYKLYSVGDVITFTNALGNISQYKIKNIKRINKLNNLLKYDEDLTIIIKNYYNLEYILLLLCEVY